ncbi:facilitated trehalose transporter Tret1-like isoform X2 [Rhynchophorus ferrugineus]|uniref:facilitated trehalose transporter Tret1-like isoform X2 n=1 Tax=Rhynchophorus ferrugineus TaxID=354439 RepID=UPI003FCDB4C4
MDCSQKKKGKSVPLQIFLAFLSNFSNIAPGMSIGFSAVAIPALVSYDQTQISWFASMASLATPLGCVVSGPIADRFGRKIAIAVVNTTAFIGWIIVGSAYYLTEQQYAVILVGRFMTGLATGLCGTPAAVYMAEIASPELRSVFTTWVSLFYALGIFWVYLLGFLFKDDWGTISFIGAAFPLVGMIFLKYFIPESPSWLVAKNRVDEAKNNMCKLYGTKNYDEDVQSEIEILLSSRGQKKYTHQKTLPQQFAKKVKLLMRRSFWKPFLLVITYFFFQQFTGIFVIMFYAIDIVKGAKVEMDAYVTIVLIATARLVAMLLLSYCSKHYGRRPLSILSGTGMAICMLILGSYILCIKQGIIDEENEKKLAMIPVILLILYFFISTMGFYPIPFALSSEVYPRNIRGTAAGLGAGANFLFNFITVKIYPSMVDSMSSYGVFFFYGGMSVIGTIFVIFFLPETRGKTLEEIQDYFVKKKEDNFTNRLEKGDTA